MVHPLLLDVADHPGFALYAVLLIFAGAVTILLSSPLANSRRHPVFRLISIVLGVVYVGYGFYLLLDFKGGHYIIFFRAFIVPIVLIIGALRQRRGNGPAAQRTAMPTTGGPTPPAPAAPTASAGWYADPQGSGRYRWWDGTQWGELAPESPA